MSNYENYASTAETYDQTRVPIGLTIILGALVRGSVPLARQRILDSGCGTGNYLAALRAHVGKLSGIDLSEAMVAEARKKFSEDDAVDLRVGSLLELPFESGDFDGVVCNQVLHHLSDDRGSRGDQTRCLAELYRVLRPGGCVTINTSSHRQLRDGYWWAALVPQGVERVSLRFPDTPVLKDLLEQVGFVVEGVHAPLLEVLQGSAYTNLRGPLDPAWRKGDSTWTLATPKEVEAACERVRGLDAERKLEAWVAERELLRCEFGQTTFIVARKS